MKSINKPDLKAPRFRPTRKTICDRSFYAAFKKKHPQYRNIPDTLLKKIIKMHGEELYKAAIDNRDGVEFPEGMGFIFIGTCKSPKRHLTDFSASLKYNMPLQHRNFESDNYIAKIFYTNYANKYKFRNRELWYFKGARNFTRTVGKTYPQNWKMYVQVENFEMINKLFKNAKARQYYAKKLENDILDYNEFEMN